MANQSCKIISREASDGRHDSRDGDNIHADAGVPGLLHSLSVPGTETPYHKLRRASHNIISGLRPTFTTLEFN